jgi:alanine dehydrogenase
LPLFKLNRFAIVNVVKSLTLMCRSGCIAVDYCYLLFFMPTKIKKISVGVAKEIKSGESRVALSPSGVAELVKQGNTVLVEVGAGERIGFLDSTYKAAGAVVVSRSDLFAQADMIVKVKEPQESEIAMLREGQIMFSYLHLAPDAKQTTGLLEKKVIGIAFETITSPSGFGLPLLAPMSQVAGRLAVQHASYFLNKTHGGNGILLGGVPGTPRGQITIIGGGVAGTYAASMAIGFGANVVILDKYVNRLYQLKDIFGDKVTLIAATDASIEKYVCESDVVIGAALVPGALAPKLVTKNMVKSMQKGSVLVDISIDQGGCFETSHATTHADPVFEVDGVIHYCVANMPGAVPKTSSAALEAAILQYVLKIANDPIVALRSDKNIRDGLNVYCGKVTCSGVASALNYKYHDAAEVLNN